MIHLAPPFWRHRCYTYDMVSDLIVLDSVDALERLLVVSDKRLVLLFKHSVTCGTSAQAHEELMTHLREGRHAAQYAVVTVQTHRDVSDEVVVRLNVRHETPQALLIQNGRVVWEASHFNVTGDTIRSAIGQHFSAVT